LQMMFGNFVQAKPSNNLFDEVLHENHALAFNTLLSSQETDAYIRTRILEPGARGAHISFPSVYPIVTILVKPPDPGASGLAPLGDNPANLL
ncbi:hypothetical protein, partial [Nonomuraea terrae]|uniref:hypothetical protein n=1 Tax=Nonomuraea terrae TaxID=2530383 RepID=UPI001CB71CD9